MRNEEVLTVVKGDLSLGTLILKYSHRCSWIHRPKNLISMDNFTMRFFFFTVATPKCTNQDAPAFYGYVSATLRFHILCAFLGFPRSVECSSDVHA